MLQRLSGLICVDFGIKDKQNSRYEIFDRLLIFTFVFVVSFSASVDVFHHDLSFELESQECQFSNCQTSILMILQSL